MTLLAKFWLWLVSIVISIVIWLSVQIIQEQTDRYIEMPLRIVNFPGRLVVTGLNDEPVRTASDMRITLHAVGPQNLVEDLAKSVKLEASVDCKGQGPGRPKLKVILPTIPNRFGGVKFDPATIIPNDNHIKLVILDAKIRSSPTATIIIVKFLKTVNMATVKYCKVLLPV